MAPKDSDLAKRYAENTGREHRNLPEDHPDRWQWEYRGTKAERAELAERLGLIEEEEPPVVIEGQEELF